MRQITHCEVSGMKLMVAHILNASYGGRKREPLTASLPHLWFSELHASNREVPAIFFLKSLSNILFSVRVK